MTYEQNQRNQSQPLGGGKKSCIMAALGFDISQKEAFGIIAAVVIIALVYNFKP